MGAAEAKRIPVGGDDADVPETAAGTRDRAPVEGVMDSTIPTQSLVRKCRVGDLHLARVADKGVAQEHAQSQHFDMEEKIGTQSAEDPGALSVLGGGGPALPARFAEERDRVSRQELTGEAGRARVGLALRAIERKLVAWMQFKAYPPAQMDTQAQDVVDTRWALTWKEADRKKTVRARVPAHGVPGPRDPIRQCGYSGLCVPDVLIFASDALGDPGEMEDLEAGRQDCLLPSRGIWPRSVCSRPM